jgi:hypothetical protein
MDDQRDLENLRCDCAKGTAGRMRWDNHSVGAPPKRRDVFAAAPGKFFVAQQLSNIYVERMVTPVIWVIPMNR